MTRSAGARSRSARGGSRQSTAMVSTRAPAAPALARVNAERLVVPVGGEGVGAPEGGDDGRQADAAAELHGPQAAEGAGGEPLGEHERARPQLGPVGQALVAGVVDLVDEVLRAAGPEDGEHDRAHGHVQADRVEGQ